MALALDLTHMSISEKLGALEEIWEDLRRHSDRMPSPAWHGDVLKKRLESARAGKSQFRSIDAVKSEMRTGFEA